MKTNLNLMNNLKIYVTLILLTLFVGGIVLTANVFGAPTDSKLISAIKDDSIDDVKRLVGQGADVNAKDKDGFSALHVAVLQDNNAIVKYLIEKGADIEAKDSKGNTPLLNANHVDVVRCLVEMGANVDAKDSKGYDLFDHAVNYSQANTPGMPYIGPGGKWAARHYRFKPIYRYLKEYYDEKRKQTENNNKNIKLLNPTKELKPITTTRTWTATSGHKIEGNFVKLEDELVHLVLTNGKTAKIKLDQLIEEDKLFVKSKIEKKKDVSLVFADDTNDIFNAVKNGDLAAVKKLVEADPKLLKSRSKEPLITWTTVLPPNINIDNRTLLHVAALNPKSIKVLKYLIEKGCDVNADDGRNMTPLFLAITAQNNEAANYLIDHGAESPQQRHYTLTEADDYLLKAMAVTTIHTDKTVVSETNDYKLIKETTTGIGKAVHNVNTSVNERAQLMTVIANCIESIKNKRFFDAVHEENIETVKLQLKTNPKLVNAKYGSAGNTPLHHAVMNNSNLEVIMYLIENGADVNVKNDGGVTPLYAAAGYNPNVDVIKYLVKKGANLNTKSQSGGTPLLNSVAGNTNVEVTKYLIKMGADVNEGDNAGFTPLLSASANPNVEFVKCLVENGAVVNTNNNTFGTTPLHHAGLNPNVEILKYLITKGADVNANVNGLTPLHTASTEEKKQILRKAGAK
jgi:ankyrin repeat protein